jgi:hypothetical protein
MQLTEHLRYAHLPPLDEAVMTCPAIYVELARRASLDLLHERFDRVMALGALERKDGGITLARYTAYLASGTWAGTQDPR